METSSFASKRKKRSAEDALTTTGAGGSSTIRASFQTLVLEQQMHQLQAELEHERSMRKLDEKKARQSIELLEKQIELSETVAKEATSTLEDYRKTSEGRIKSLRELQDQTMQKLRECEIKLLDGDEDDDSEENDSNLVDLYKGKCEHLEMLLHQQKENEEELHKQLAKIQEELQELQSSPPAMESLPPSPKVEKLLQEAPPDIMKELHRVRMSYAESRRKERQLERKNSDMENRISRLVQEREELRGASQRLPVVEQELAQVHSTYAKMEAERGAWQEFGRSLGKILKLPSPTQDSPLEITLVEQALAQSRPQTSNFEAQSKTWQEERQRLGSRIESKDATIHELEQNLALVNREKALLEQQQKDLQSQVEKTKAQLEVSKREAENLRGLVQTFDGLPLASAAESKAADFLKSPTLDTSKRTLQISLDSVKEELRLSRAENERLKKEMATNTAEIDRVKEKFGKLKEALLEARGKVAEAEQRANEAEALAGKGSFNPDVTRVLHFTETPLVEALKEEIKVLKRQVEAGKKSKSSSKSVHHDVDKLNQRLKVSARIPCLTLQRAAADAHIICTLL